MAAVQYVAFLRAINLGKVNRVPMAALRAALEDAGFTDVRTHLQSGNVLLGSTKRSTTALERTLEELVDREFRVRADVMVRTGDALAKIARSNPLLRGSGGGAGLHVAFLKRAPSASAKRALTGRTFGKDQFVVRGTEIFLRYPQGVAGSTMNTGVFEKSLGTPGTVRTWKVVTRLAELVGP
jgi:uncharacterized protein (DUF1697 family)